MLQINSSHVPLTYTWILCSVDRAFLYNLVNETNLVHYLFLVYFVNFIDNLYMFRTSPRPSSGGKILSLRHLILVNLYSWLVCRSINIVVPNDNGPGEVRNMRNTLRINIPPSWFHLRDHLYLFSRLKMSVALQSFPPHVFVSGAGDNITFYHVISASFRMSAII